MTYSVTGSNPGQVSTKPYCKIKCKFVGIFQNLIFIISWTPGYDDVISCNFSTFKQIVILISVKMQNKDLGLN